MAHGTRDVAADVGLLAALPAGERDAVLDRATVRAFAKRHVLFHEGDPAHALYLIVDGHVAVQKSTDRGDVATVGVLGPGAVLGELALVSDDPRSATAVALDRVEVLVVQRADVVAARARDRALDRFLVEALAAVVRRVSEELLEALVLPADRRVLRRVLSLDEAYAGSRIPVTQDELASLAGTARATVNKVLRRAEEAGAVRLVRGGVDVLDEAWLVRRSR